MLARYVFGPVAALSVALLAGCEVDESAVLEARIANPTVTVTASTLTTEVSGGFELVLSLGDYGSDPTTVSIGTFALKRGDEVLLEPLDLDPTPDFPITVGVGESELVDVLIESPEGDPSLATELCAGELQLAGTVTDSLTDGRPRPVTSERFAPDCP